MIPDQRTSDPDSIGPARGGDTTDRALRGDSEALSELIRRHRDRIRRIVSVWLAARLARVLEEEELPAELLRTALLGLRDREEACDAGLVRMLAKLVESEVRRRPRKALSEPRGPRRTLRIDAAPDSRHVQREDLERVVDARVAGLEQEEYREVLLLRDYCGASWVMVRARLGLLSVEAAQELYRRAHERLARSMLPQLRRDSREQ